MEVNRAGTVTGVTNAKIDLTALDTTSANFKGNVRVASMDGISPLPEADGRFKIESATTLQIRDNAGAWHDVTAAAGGTITITAGGAVFEGHAAANADSALAVKRGGESGGSSERRTKSTRFSTWTGGRTPTISSPERFTFAASRSPFKAANSKSSTPGPAAPSWVTRP
ncbi:MAG: hypothetical protein IPP68_03780 [Elusimicrobia bacterium]|nr:hypothetical protein [Elusimicrobiota bacterium]